LVVDSLHDPLIDSLLPYKRIRTGWLDSMDHYVCSGLTGFRRSAFNWSFKKFKKHL
jgi:hypothetical protein